MTSSPPVRERCWRVLCLLGFAPCAPQWIGPGRSELWAVCQRCGKPRIFLTDDPDIGIQHP